MAAAEDAMSQSIIKMKRKNIRFFASSDASGHERMKSFGPLQVIEPKFFLIKK